MTAASQGVGRNADDRPADGFDEVVSLFTSVQSQTLDLQCQLNNATSDWAVLLNVLSGRIATLEPLLSEALKTSRDRQQTAEQFAAKNKELEMKYGEAERELVYYRPLATQLEEELRKTKEHLDDLSRRARVLETDNARALGEYNEVCQKLATTEAISQRLGEENAAYLQKLSENGTTIQAHLRGTAQLKSDLMSANSNLARSEAEATDLANRLAIENEDRKRTQAAFDSLKLQMLALKKESATQLREAEERERQSSENLVTKDKQIYDLEVKLAGVNSKNDFLERMAQQLREDLRRHLDHIGTLEASNRQLLDALSRNSSTAGVEAEPQQEQQRGQNGTPKLRAVHE